MTRQPARAYVVRTQSPKPSNRFQGHVHQISAREQAFWDEHVPELVDCLREYESGPEPNTKAMLDAVEPLCGRRVLDFACGAGITSAFLAQRGALVTAIDISHASIARAHELAERIGFRIELIAGELKRNTFPPETFDAVVGRYALHHVDLRLIAPFLGEILSPQGKGAFVETLGLNPLLNFARRRISGRFGVASYGSRDERPLDRSDLRILETNIGDVELAVGEMRFLRIFDRNVLRYRRPYVSTLIGACDDALLRLGLGSWSYHQVVKFTKQALPG